MLYFLLNRCSFVNFLVSRKLATYYDWTTLIFSGLWFVVAKLDLRWCSCQSAIYSLKGERKMEEKLRATYDKEYGIVWCVVNIEIVLMPYFLQLVKHRFSFEWSIRFPLFYFSRRNIPLLFYGPSRYSIFRFTLIVNEKIDISLFNCLRVISQSKV